MYAPSRQLGRAPSTTSHGVGGSSSTGAKFPERTCFGSREGRRGKSRKVDMKTSKDLKMFASNDGFVFLSTCSSFEGFFGSRFWVSSTNLCNVVLAEEVFTESAVIDVSCFSSILTDETLSLAFLGGEEELAFKYRGNFGRKEEESVSIAVFNFWHQILKD